MEGCDKFWKRLTFFLSVVFPFSHKIIIIIRKCECVLDLFKFGYNIWIKPLTPPNCHEPFTQLLNKERRVSLSSKSLISEPKMHSGMLCANQHHYRVNLSHVTMGSQLIATGDVHPSIICRFSGCRVAGAAAWAEKPRRPCPRPLPPALTGRHQGVLRPAERHSLSNMSWVFPGVFPGVSSQWDVPGTPHQGGVQEAS